MTEKGRIVVLTPDWTLELVSANTVSEVLEVRFELPMLN